MFIRVMNGNAFSDVVSHGRHIITLICTHIKITEVVVVLVKNEKESFSEKSKPCLLSPCHTLGQS